MLKFDYQTYDSDTDASPSERWRILGSNILVVTQQMAAVEQLPRLTAVRRQGGPVRARGGRDGQVFIRCGQGASCHND
jgi:hypothetical protein